MSSKDKPIPAYRLIQSLTTSEKEGFRRYVRDSDDERSPELLELFEVLVQINTYDDQSVQLRMKHLGAAKLANLKSHLYKQILLVLRSSHLKYDVDIQLRENLDYIRLLYKKGLYDLSLKQLNKVKITANSYKKNIFKLSLLNYEKNIENQQMLTLDTTTCLKLDRETHELIGKIDVCQSFFSVALIMKAHFMRVGIVRSVEQLEHINKLFYTNLPEYDKSRLTFSEQYNLCRAYYWYSYITQDFNSCVSYTELWVSIFKENNLTHLRHAEFLRGLNRLLQSLFRLSDRDRFDMYFEELLHFEKLYMKAIDHNSKQLLLRCLTVQTFNKCFLDGDYEHYEKTLNRYLVKIECNLEYIDSNSQLIIFYNAAVLSFGLENYLNCIAYLDRIISNTDENLREDLKSFAYILKLISIFEQREFVKLEKTTQRALVYLRQRDILGQFHQIMLEFIKNAEGIPPDALKLEFERLRSSLEPLKLDKFESKPFLYFDVISWLDSKISERKFGSVIKEKAQENTVHYSPHSL